MNPATEQQNPYETWAAGLGVAATRAAVRELELVLKRADGSDGLVSWRFTPTIFWAVRRFGELPSEEVGESHAVRVPAGHLVQLAETLIKAMSAHAAADSLARLRAPKPCLCEKIAAKSAARWEGSCKTCRKHIAEGLPIFLLDAGWSCYECLLELKSHCPSCGWSTDNREAA